MSDPLRFTSLRIRRMPGFPHGGPALDDLSPGINLVAGPNASGKTTTARAIQRLLWPGTGGAAVSLLGRFSIAGSTWVVDVDGRRVLWEREGEPATAPPLPPSETRDRYLLSLRGLLRDEDRELADRIRVESAGGYDVPAAAEALGFGAGGRPRTLVDDLSAAREALTNARSRAQELRDDRRELRALRARLEEVEAATTAARALEKALELARAQSHVAEARREVEAFPDVLARLRGNEVERLDGWEAEEARHRKALAEAEARIQDAARRIEEAGLGHEGLDRGVIQTLEGRVDEVREVKRTVVALQDQLAAASSRFETEERALDPSPEKSPAPSDHTLGDHTLDRLDDLLRRTEELRARRAELDARRKALEAEDDSPAGDAEALGEAAHMLRAWLRATGGDPDTGATRDRLLLRSAVALVIFGAAALLLGLADLEPRLSATLAGAAALVAGVAFLVLRPTSASDPREGLERDVARTGHAPDEWTVDAVRDRLDTLESELRRAERAGRVRDEVVRLDAEEVRLEEEAGEVREERAALADLLEIPPLPELRFHVVGTRIVARERARRDAVELQARLAEARDRMEAIVETAAGPVRALGHEPTDAASLAAALTDLRERREMHRTAVRDRDEAVRRRDESREALDGIEEARRTLFERLGLPGPGHDDPETELRSLARRREAYGEARDELEAARRLRDAAEAGLRSRAEAGDDEARSLVEEEVGPAHVDMLESRLGAVEEAREERDDLRERIARIDQALQQAREAHDVEEALAREAAAAAALEERRAEDAEAEVGMALTRWLQRDTSDHDRPAVFHRARELLVAITRGRYELRMGRGEPVEFRAFDTREQRGRALHELSDGTRLQLLLAVRIAFVETQEPGVALPLLFDEVLANSDDPRAHAIIDAAVALAEEGRQLFYFTAQADELARWRTRLEGSGIPWCERRLGPRSGLAEGFDWDTGGVGPTEVPAPDGKGYVAYGRTLGVAPFDPWGSTVAGLHLWHLLDDAQTLHELLELGISTWGELESFAAGAGSAIPPVVRTAVEAARPRSEVCRHFAELYRRGRDRPLDRSVLVASEAVSDTFIDEVAELAEELGGRGSALVQALRNNRVSRFQGRMTDRLEAYLYEEGYLSDEAPLEPDEILLRVTASARRAGVEHSRAESERVIARLARGPDGVREEDAS